MKKHTDLDGVKQVASALLFTDIEKTKYSPMVVQRFPLKDLFSF